MIEDPLSEKILWKEFTPETIVVNPRRRDRLPGDRGERAAPVELAGKRFGRLSTSPSLVTRFETSVCGWSSSRWRGRSWPSRCKVDTKVSIRARRGSGVVPSARSSIPTRSRPAERAAQLEDGWASVPHPGGGRCIPGCGPPPAPAQLVLSSRSAPGAGRRHSCARSADTGPCVTSPSRATGPSSSTTYSARHGDLQTLKTADHRSDVVAGSATRRLEL